MLSYKNLSYFEKSTEPKFYEDFEKAVTEYKKFTDLYAKSFKEKQDTILNLKNQIKQGLIPADVSKKYEKLDLFHDCMEMRRNEFVQYDSRIQTAGERCFYSLEHLEYLSKIRDAHNKFMSKKF